MAEQANRNSAQFYKTFERRTAKQVEVACGACNRAIYLMPSAAKAQNFCTHEHQRVHGKQRGGLNRGVAA